MYHDLFYLLSFYEAAKVENLAMDTGTELMAFLTEKLDNLIPVPIFDQINC